MSKPRTWVASRTPVRGTGAAAAATGACPGGPVKAGCQSAMPSGTHLRPRTPCGWHHAAPERGAFSCLTFSHSTQHTIVFIWGLVNASRWLSVFVNYQSSWKIMMSPVWRVHPGVVLLRVEQYQERPPFAESTAENCSTSQQKDGAFVMADQIPVWAENYLTIDFYWEESSVYFNINLKPFIQNRKWFLYKVFLLYSCFH